MAIGINIGWYIWIIWFSISIIRGNDRECVFFFFVGKVAKIFGFEFWLKIKHEIKWTVIENWCEGKRKWSALKPNVFDSLICQSEEERKKNESWSLYENWKQQRKTKYGNISYNYLIGYDNCYALDSISIKVDVVSKLPL